MTTPLNVSPYYDDFDSAANFHQILFKPSFAVQARELTQIQSILRNQIAKFGSHVFKHGSVVLPGNVSTDLTLCYVNLATAPTTMTLLDGATVVGASGLKALVKSVVAASTTDTNSTLLVSYFNTGTADESVFAPNEVLTITTKGGIVLSNAVAAAVDSVGGASAAFITSGVFFINGTFVEVLPQYIIISRYSNVPDCKVLLKITEEIVTAASDETLLDPAQGSYNYSAPGADRLKITLTLTSLATDVEVGDDYVELMRYVGGVLESNARYAKYNELEKSLARRTYDESGDYIANGLKISLSESIKKPFNGGKLTNGSADDYAIEVAPGKAYITGFESEIISPRIVTAPKGRGLTPNHIKERSVSVIPSYGQYIYVTNLKSLPVFSTRSSVTLYNSIASNGAATSIGTADVVAIDLHESNSTDQTAIYKLYLTNITVTNIASTGCIKFTGGSADVVHKLTVNTTNLNFTLAEVVSASSNVATVTKWIAASSALYVTKHTVAAIPLVGSSITGGTSGTKGTVSAVQDTGSNTQQSPIIQLPISAVYKVKTNIGTAGSPVYSSNATYKVFKEISITVNSGTGAFTVSNCTIDPIEQGNCVATNAAGIVPNSRLSLSPDGLTITYTGPDVNGTVIKIVCAATKTAVSNRTKTLVSNSGSPDTGLTPANIVMLTHGDIYELTSVVSTVEGDVTSRFKFNNGQTDYSYEFGSLVLIGTMPTGTLTVTYKYFSHSGTGDYFSVDSYVSSGLTDYYSTMKSYISTTDGTEYDLHRCLDFRPKFDTTNTVIDMPVIDSRITTSIQYYVPRYDAISLDPTGKITIVYGVPSDTPSEPVIRPGTISLGSVYVPPYTFSIADMVLYPTKSKGYKMRDIKKIEDRILNLEQYTTLNNSESSLVNNDIVDAATGLSRYKSGYLVESFVDMTKIADFQNAEFKASYITNELCPAMEKYDVALDYVSTTGKTLYNATSKNWFVTIGYTQVVFAQNNSSTRITNINPFSVFAWKGTLNLVPSVDNFTNYSILPPVNNTINNITYTTETIDVPRPWGYIPEYPSINDPDRQTFSFAPVQQNWIDWGSMTENDASKIAVLATTWHQAYNSNGGIVDGIDYGAKNSEILDPSKMWWIPDANTQANRDQFVEVRGWFGVDPIIK